MRTELPSGTSAELVHPSSGPADRGLVLIPDVMGMRPLFDDLVARLSSEQEWSVCAFELYPGRENLEVGDRNTHETRNGTGKIGVAAPDVLNWAAYPNLPTVEPAEN